MVAALSAPAQAAEGLSIQDSTWPRWQARLWLGPAAASPASTAETVTRIGSASLLGDYYFGASGLRLGGFRATSGLLVGGLAGPLGGRSVGLSGRMSASSLNGPSGIGAESGEAAADLSSAVPYLGLGYSNAGPLGGWGFSADLGLVAQNPSGAVQFGRALFGPARGLEDAVRQMRLTPVLQVGVRYAF